jgi:pyruvate dehydrogenase E2 component (dihydrolipoamide acetyltransferase)
MIIEITIPEISENVTSGSVVSVLLAQGNPVDVDDVIIELETDKAVVEIPSTAKGVLKELLVKEGDEVQVGDVIARIDTQASAPAGTRETPPPAAAAEPQAEAQPVSDESVPAPASPTPAPASPKPPPPAQAHPPTPRPEPPAPAGPDRSDRPAAPSVRRLARELGVDLHRVAASGAGGRITQDDVKAHIRQVADDHPAGAPPTMAAPIAAAAETVDPNLPDFSRWGEIESVDLDTVRRITADNMQRSWNTVPHVTQFDEADLTAVQDFIGQNAKRVADQGGKLTASAVLTKICALALVRFPRFNASLDSAAGKLVLKKYVNVGIAVDTPRGLLVPVVRNASGKSITQIAIEITDLAQRARDKKIKPDEMEGGTFTLSNQGGIGGTNFTPIVFWPQVAILGVSRSAVRQRLVGDAFAARPILPLSLSYDHRVIDGADAARFLRWVCDSLSHPLTMLLD